MCITEIIQGKALLMQYSIWVLLKYFPFFRNTACNENNWRSRINSSSPHHNKCLILNLSSGSGGSWPLWVTALKVFILNVSTSNLTSCITRTCTKWSPQSIQSSHALWCMLLMHLVHSHPLTRHKREKRPTEWLRNRFTGLPLIRLCKIFARGVLPARSSHFQKAVLSL